MMEFVVVKCGNGNLRLAANRAEAETVAEEMLFTASRGHYRPELVAAVRAAIKGGTGTIPTEMGSVLIQKAKITFLKSDAYLGVPFQNYKVELFREPTFVTVAGGLQFSASDRPEFDLTRRVAEDVARLNGWDSPVADFIAARVNNLTQLHRRGVAVDAIERMARENPGFLVPQY